MEETLRGRVYLGLQALRGRPLGRWIRRLREWERLDAAEFERRHEDRLRLTLAHAAACVPLYRTEPWRSVLSGGSDRLERWPILEREVLRERSDALRARPAPRRQVVRQTSGSTGAPIRVALTPEAEAWGWAHRYRGLGWHGIPVGARALRLSHDRHPLRDRVLGQVSLPELDGEAALETAARILRARPSERPRLVAGPPSTLFRLARYLRETGATAPLVPFARSGGEQLFGFQRSEIQDRLAERVIDSYGSTEAGALAGECPAGSLHVYAEHVHLEIVQGDTPVAPGEFGDIVATPLGNLAMPLIRYRVGDRGRLSPEPCRCGLPHPVLLDLQARLGDTIVAADGSVHHASVLVEALEPFFAAPISAGVRQLRFDPIDRLTWEVRIEAPRLLRAGDDGIRALAALERRLAEIVRRTFGAPCRVEASLVEAIPRERGKFRYYRVVGQRRAAVP